MNMNDNIVKIGKPLICNALYMMLCEIEDKCYYSESNSNGSQHFVIQSECIDLIIDSLLMLDNSEVTDDLKKFFLEQLSKEIIEGDFISGAEDFMEYMNKFEKFFEYYDMKDSWVYELFYQAISIAMRDAIESNLEYYGEK